jgi:molybdate transport system ATP-binding protein
MSEPLLRASFRGELGSFTLDAAFDAPARGVTGLFGPSGCGKTSVLRCIAGLQRLDDGYFAIGDDIWQDRSAFRPTYRRPIGYVFQEASLFPHLSVRRNLLYGAPADHSNDLLRFDDVIDLLGIQPLLDRSTRNLSGGERQRVAIGRALLSQPKLLLMDEPLSALDKMTKEEILPFLERLHESLSLPVIYISHDMAEIERLADHLVLMSRGRVLASGPIAELQSDPALPLAGSQDAAVSLDAVVESFDPAEGLARLAVPGATLLAPAAHAAQGDRRRMRILAGDVSLAREEPPPSTIINIIKARILDVRASDERQVTAVLGLGEDGAGVRVLSRVTRRSWERLGFAPGQVVHAQIKGVALASRTPPAATEHTRAAASTNSRSPGVTS